MSAVYQVKRFEPLPVSNIKVVFHGGLSDNNGDDQDDHDEYSHYMRSISATINGRETASGKQVKLGETSADLMEVKRAMQNGESIWDVCDTHSEGLAMLHKACFTERAFWNEVLPTDYNSGDILMVNTIRLDPRFRGYGIGLLAIERLVEFVARAFPEWRLEGMIFLEPSGMTSDVVQGSNHGDIQEKLIRYYGLLGLEVLVRETRRHCTFVGQWMGYKRPGVDEVVPHLLQ